MSADPIPCARVSRVATTRIPTRHAMFTAYCYRDELTDVDHVVLTLGELADSDEAPEQTTADTPPLVRLHSECFTGDSLGSRRCDCGDQLDAAQAAIASGGARCRRLPARPRGPGHRLAAKLRAYELQDGGLDTIDANLALGLPVDAREYGAAVEILATSA